MGSTVAFPSLYFRYRGTFDLTRMYREGRAFFTKRDFKFNEKKIKYKSDEFEAVWENFYHQDAYHKFFYNVEWHCYDMVPTKIKGPDGTEIDGYTGKIWIRIDPGYEMDYDEKTFAGKVKIFDDSKGMSWLHKVYKRITYGDRDYNYEYDLAVFAQKFLDHIKGIMNVDAK